MTIHAEPGLPDDAGADNPTAESFRTPNALRWRCTQCDAQHLLLYRRRSAGPCVACGSAALEALT